jgi:nitroreductase
MNENETIKIIKQRRSIRQFLEKQISENDLNTIINTGLYAPNGGTNLEEDIYFVGNNNSQELKSYNIKKM